MEEHLHDMIPLLDLMHNFNPRAKAVAVLNRDVSKQLQQMLHPKVMGYVAAEDAAAHLADAVLEVAQGKFTASPAISDVVMQLTSQYLASRPSPISKPAQLTAAGAHEANDSGHSPMDSNFGSASIPSPASGYGTSVFGSSSFVPSNFSSFSGFGVSASQPRPALQSLSEREGEILQLIAGGLSSADIGQELAISVPTVNTHIRNIFTKLNVRTRAQAIHTGISQGLIMVQ
ncbi:helix-turn-helix transcriptional regulator [Variovorax sp. PCZ-1]|nr:helix-turn-helix transcriptional regulator [Variovorax sp. PCZ-1]